MKTILALISISLLLFVLSIGCTTQKHIVTAKTNIDSSVIRELQDSVRLLVTEKQGLEQKIHELEFGSVIFDSTRCPQIHFPEGAAMMNKDSVQSLIDQLNESISGMNNKIKRYADGTIEVTGRLKSANYSKDKLSEIVYYQQKTIPEFSVYSENAAGANFMYQIQKSGPNEWLPIGTITQDNNSILTTKDQRDFDVARLRIAGTTSGVPVVIHGIEITTLTIKGQDEN